MGLRGRLRKALTWLLELLMALPDEDKDFSLTMIESRPSSNQKEMNHLHLFRTGPLQRPGWETLLISDITVIITS